MAGKIIADIIEAPFDSIKMNVANVTVLTANNSGLTYLPTGNVNINIGSTASLTLGNVVATTANISGLITASGGIKFPATQAASADVNTLDDYEEGTWTPVVAGSASAGTGTYTIQEGTYTKIGNIAITNCYIAWSAHTGTGDFTIIGLPFASNASYTVQAGSIFANEFNAGTNATQLIAYPSAGNATIIFRGFVNNATRTAPVMDTSASVGVTLTYRV